MTVLNRLSVFFSGLAALGGIITVIVAVRALTMRTQRRTDITHIAKPGRPRRRRVYDRRLRNDDRLSRSR